MQPPAQLALAAQLDVHALVQGEAHEVQGLPHRDVRVGRGRRGGRGVRHGGGGGGGGGGARDGAAARGECARAATALHTPPPHPAPRVTRT